MIYYPASNNPLGYYRAAYPGVPWQFADLTAEGFALWAPADWESDPWEYWRAQYPEDIGQASQASPEQVAAWVPEVSPPEEPLLTDVEAAAKKIAERREIREDLIFSPTAGLVGTCYAWLQRPCVVPGQEGTESKSPSAALAAGQGLCSAYGAQLRKWIDFAAPDFFTSMSSPDAARPWLEWIPAGVGKSIRESILDKIYLATYGVARP